MAAAHCQVTNNASLPSLLLPLTCQSLLHQVEEEGCGYFEDRRPASNMDPYVVTGMILKTTLLD
jgi:hypothetical protein